VDTQLEEYVAGVVFHVKRTPRQFFNRLTHSLWIAVRSIAYAADFHSAMHTTYRRAPKLAAGVAVVCCCAMTETALGWDALVACTSELGSRCQPMGSAPFSGRLR
jgi:hypothetical protein